MTLHEAVAARNDLIEYGWCRLAPDRRFEDVRQVVSLVPARVISTWTPDEGWWLEIVREEES